MSRRFFFHLGTKRAGGTILLLLILSLWGCVSHVQELREAQDQFNLAASLENQQKIDPLRGDMIASGTQASASYQLTRQILADLLAKKKQDLERDNLLGAAYTLKALAEWRLGDYKTALATVEQCPEQSLYARDQAMVKALRGLIKNDQAYRHLVENDYSYDNIKTLLRESTQDLSRVIQSVPDHDSLRMYLALAKLAALKNWKDLRGDRRIQRPASFDDYVELQEWCAEAKPAWAFFAEEVGKLDTPEANASKRWWAFRLSMPQACP